VLTEKKKRILHIITGLSIGGAEMMLLKLLTFRDEEKFDHCVISLLGDCPLGDNIRKLGIKVVTINMNRGKPRISDFYKLIVSVRGCRPEIIQGWMYHGNIAASIASFFLLYRPRVVWNIRQSLYDIKTEKRRTAFLIKLGKLISFHPFKIIYNSQISKKQHETFGYSADKSWTIPNGFDCDYFKPDIHSHLKLRKELNVTMNSKIVGMVARFHPVKDHCNFFKAAKLINEKDKKTHFVLAGIGVDDSNKYLISIIDQLGLNDCVHLLGERRDIPYLMAGFDIFVLSSSFEGFPNVIGEAMASGVVCVSTDVGDSSLIIQNTGLVVFPNDFSLLASAVLELLKLKSKERLKMGLEARERVKSQFSLKHIVEKYERLYQDLLHY
jgi:glycosyltransferase involved in cell wall biosynthesis